MEYTEVWLRLVELNTERYTLTIKNCKIPKKLDKDFYDTLHDIKGYLTANQYTRLCDTLGITEEKGNG